LRVEMAFPGGAGYGSSADRDADKIKRDIALGSITTEHAAEHYKLSATKVAEVIKQSKPGEYL